MFLKTASQVKQFGNVKAIEGIVQFQSIRLNVYCYELDGVLIDTGSKTLFPQFKPFLQQADIDFAVITHHHEDHTGGAHFLNIRQIPIYISPMSVEVSGKKADYPLYRKIFWGARKPFEANPMQSTFQSRMGTWQVIETPGHAVDHLSFYNEQTGQLFSGDLFISPKTKLVLREEHVPTIISSLQKVLTFDFQELFCQHAGYIKNGKKAITNKLEFLMEIQYQVQALYQQGKTIDEIQHQLFPKKYPITKVSFGEWDSKHIVTSILTGI